MDPDTRKLATQGLLNKKPSERLGWPQLLYHPFVRESSLERLKREAALADANRLALTSRAWKGEDVTCAGGPLRPFCTFGMSNWETAAPPCYS